MSHGAEFHFETLIGWRNNLTARTFHRSFHGAGEVSDSAGPIALAESDFIRAIADPVIREGPEKLNRFNFVIMTSFGWVRLTRPEHSRVLGMPFSEDLPVLGIPGVVQGFHEFQVLFDSHLRYLLKSILFLF